MISAAHGARLAEAMLYDYEFTPPGVEVLDRQDLLMWRRRDRLLPWANRVA